MDFKCISACLVSRSYPVDPRITESLSGFGEIVEGDGTNCRLYGRFEGIKRAKHDLIYTQDDDFLVTSFDRLLKKWDGRFVTHHNTSYNRIYRAPFTTIGYGAIFRRDVVLEALDYYESEYGRDKFFWRGCDIIVTGLCNPVRAGFLGAPLSDRYKPSSIGVNLPNSDAATTTHNQPGQREFWTASKNRVRELIKKRGW